MLAFVPRPVIAILLLFPVTDKYEAFRKEQEERLKNGGNVVSPSVYFLRQTISNACGTIGILHSLANNTGRLTLSPTGVLKRILDRGASKTPEERGADLEGNEELARLHDESSHEGQTAAPDPADEVDLHFVALVKVDGEIYELDGNKPFPINHGPTDDLLQIRYYRTTISQAFVTPVLFMFLLFILQIIDYRQQQVEVRTPPESPLPGIGNCQGPEPGDPCINIMYAKPTNIPRAYCRPELYDGIMAKFSAINSKRTGETEFVMEAPVSNMTFRPDRRYDIVPIPDESFLYQYLLLNPNTTNWAVAFKCNDSEVVNIQYEIWYNSTLTANFTDNLGTDIYGRALTNFIVLVLVFFLFTMAMIFMGLFITTLVKKARVGVLVGIFVVVVGLLVQSFVFAWSFIGYIFWTSANPTWIPNVLALLPFFNFGKFFMDITTLTVGKYDALTSSWIPGPGFSLASMFEPVPKDYLPVYPTGIVLTVPPPIQSIYFLLGDVAFYWTLTWYFDNVIPNEYGFALRPWFFLTPSYWNIYSWVAKYKDVGEWMQQVLSNSKSEADGVQEDEDVQEERKAVYDLECTHHMKIVNLRKVYRNRLSNRNTKKAVKSLCLGLQKGQLLALLGQNGAGKSTTMNILAGLSRATSGDAFIFNKSVRSQIHELRGMMGVCPQHDILFNDLTAREHILLFAGLKGIPQAELNHLLSERLDAVKLLKVANRKVGKFSGGMEEADILGDRIAIMAKGCLRAIGDSLTLKRKYGAGYRVSLIVHPGQEERAKQIVPQMIPGVVLEDEAGESLLYQFPGNDSGILPRLIRYLEKNPDGWVKSWGISQTTLEEVFLKL
ncbi:ATP-binding cassette sub- A member 1 [Phlyctochytrium bullatum]|nr:ATP-binding cassette sub- A member 1 [Phlyctochytrium bullatum]